MKTKQLFISLLSLVAVLSIVSLANAAGSWSNPTGTPPANNVEAPINIGTSPQDKSGVLRVNGFRSFFDAIFDTKVQIGTTSVMAQNLRLLADGKVGAEAYCDRQGNNCVTSSGIAVTSTTTSTTNGGGSTVKAFEQSIPLNTVLTTGTFPVAHGLGKAPNLVKVTLVNLSPEAGYSPGDEVEITSWYYSSVMANASYIYFTSDRTIVSQGNNSFSINNKAGNWPFSFCPNNGCNTSGSVGHNGKWNMRFQAFVF